MTEASLGGESSWLVLGAPRLHYFVLSRACFCSCSNGTQLAKSPISSILWQSITYYTVAEAVALHTLT